MSNSNLLNVGDKIVVNLKIPKDERDMFEEWFEYNHKPAKIIGFEKIHPHTVYYLDIDNGAHRWLAKDLLKNSRLSEFLHSEEGVIIK